MCVFSSFLALNKHLFFFITLAGSKCRKNLYIQWTSYIIFPLTLKISNVDKIANRFYLADIIEIDNITGIQI